MLYFDNSLFWHDVLTEMEKPDTETVILSSFGIYAGINETGDNTAQKYGFDDTNQRILNLSEKVKKFIVLFSEADINPCTPGCLHCKAKLVKRDMRTAEHIKRWPKVAWFMTKDHHLKAVIIVKNDKRLIAWTGGRNFSTSTWTDCSLQVFNKDAEELKDYVLQLIKQKSVRLN